MSGIANLTVLLGATLVPPTWALLIVFGSIVASIMIGSFLAKLLRMKDYAWKFSLILCTVVLSVEFIANTWDPEKKSFDVPIGVDLAGGVILVYEVNDEASMLAGLGKLAGPESSAASDQEKPRFDMTSLIDALKRRIDPTGTREIVVRPFGPTQVEIVVPKVSESEMQDIKERIAKAGVLQFRIVANRRDHLDFIGLAERMAQEPATKRNAIVREGNRQVAFWAPVAVDTVETTPQGNKRLKTPVANDVIRDGATGDLIRIPADVQFSDTYYFEDWLAEKKIERVEVLMYSGDGFDVNGSHLGAVYPGHDSKMMPCVRFNMAGEGAGLFGALTGANRPDGSFHRQLGIVLDNELISAPNLISQINDSGEISGSFTQKEVDFLVMILRAGSLPVVLHKEPISENVISSFLGEETIRKGKASIVISLLTVLVFMLIYYRFSGVIACLVLFLNLIFIVALMVAIKAPFTLPGLAGLVLTVGMAVDANVLIYERMREEIARGSALRMTIRNGFSRAMSTIVDSNLTTILTGVVLYVVGTDQLRGFAVTLVLGLIISMFTAVFCARVCFDVAERQRWLKEIRMMGLIGETKIDFMKLGTPAVFASVVLVIVGLIATVQLGSHILDTDLSGGTSVVMSTKEPITPGEVRAKVGPKFDAQKIQYTVTGINVNNQGTTRLVKIDTSFKNVAELQGLIRDTFKIDDAHTVLETYSADFKPPRLIETAAKAEPPSDATTKDATTGNAPKPDDTKQAPKKDDAPATKAEKDDAGKDAPAKDAPAKEEPAKEEPKKQDKDETKKEEAKPEDAPKDEKKETPKPTEEAKSESPKKEEAKPDEPKKEESPKDDSNCVVADEADKVPEEKSTEDQPAQDKSTEEKPAAEKPAAEKPADEKKSEAKPDEKKPAETKPESPKDAPKADESKAEEAKPDAPADAKAEDAAAKDNAAKNDSAKENAPSPIVLTETEFSFTNAISFESLENELKASATALGIDLPFVDPQNANWNRQSKAGLEKWSVRMPLDVDQATKVAEHLKAKISGTPVWQSASKIGPQVAGDAKRRALWALFASWIGITLYTWFRFQHFVYGIAAVVALIHDVLVTIAFIAMSHWVANQLGFLLVEEFRISLSVVAALLTIIGYSINDTIVIFDRMREVKGKSPALTADMINRSVNQTLGRTILTFVACFLVVLVLYVFGGEGIHAFAFSLVIGTISGVYSTVFIASPLVLWIANRGSGSQSPGKKASAA